MATTPEAAAPAGFGTRLREFFEGVRAEMHKVTWPDRPQIQQATIQIIVFVLFIGAVIGLMDVGLQFILIRLPQLLLGR